MSLRNHVIWNDGLFIKPHHFQQQQRYMEFFCRFTAEAIEHYCIGLTELEINEENLLHGKFSIERAVGTMPDGTILDIPGESAVPQPLDFKSENVVNQRVFLAQPLRANGVPEVLEESNDNQNIRMKSVHQEVRDITSVDTEPYFVEVASHEFKLMLESEDRSTYSSLPLARIVEKRADGSLVLDSSFMPTSSTIGVLPELNRVLADFTGLIQHRAHHIAGRLGSPGQGGVPEVADFMMLQLLNRLGAQFQHIGTIQGVHPRDLYELFVSSASELATFTHESRLPEKWPAYNHLEPHHCFKPVVESLRRSLSVMLEPNAVALPLTKHKYGIMTATVSDQSMILNSVFVIAVKAGIPLEKLSKDFPAQTKVSSIEKIRDLINLHLPGVVMQLLPAPPRQLPYHAGFTYFQLDSNSSGWADLKNSSGFAFHFAGEFPELEIQFWAIRNQGGS